MKASRMREGPDPAATHPEITWSVVLDAALTDPVAAAAAAARLGNAWPDDGRAGPPPTVREATHRGFTDQVEAFANEPYAPGGPFCRILVGSDVPRVLVAGHHAVLDGLGLIAVLGSVLGEPVETDAAGLGSVRARRPRSGYQLGRALEAVARPPTRIAPDGGTLAVGDHLVRASARGGLRSADLVAAAASAIGSWNARHGARADRIVVAVGASVRGGTSPGIGRGSAWFRIRVREADPDHVREALRTRGPEPSGPPRLAGPTRALAAVRALQRRTGSTVLVSNLGRFEPSGSVVDAGFFPSAHGRSGVAIGAIGAGERITLTLRARMSDFSRSAAQDLLELVVARALSRRSRRRRMKSDARSHGVSAIDSAPRTPIISAIAA